MRGQGEGELALASHKFEHLSTSQNGMENADWLTCKQAMT